MILYQILNTETGKKLVNSGGYWASDVWSNAGAFWRTPDTIKKHLQYLLYEYEEYTRHWNYDDNRWKREEYIQRGVPEATAYLAFPIKMIYKSRQDFRKTEKYNHELSKVLQVVATEMQTVGASKAYSVEHFMDKVPA